VPAGLVPERRSSALGCAPSRRFASEFGRSVATSAGEAVITRTEVSLAYVEEYLAEDEPLVAARRNAVEVGGASPIGTVGGATLRFLAAAIGARAVVEIGTGCGVSGIWLLRGMLPEGVLTSVDVEPEHQRLARQAYAAAGFATNRYRLIGGRALDVLPRLTDGGYDMVLCDADKQEYPDYLTAALRLLRPGGIVIFDNALWNDRVADPAYQDEDTSAIREVCERLQTDEQVVPLLLPVGDGLLAGVKRPE
jgi:predicted O-methyltransferase YrrM